jgi:aspartate kinase
MKVMKFGGSSIKTPKLMKKVAEVIKNERDDKVIVVSALSGQTNEIREYLKTIETEKKDINAFVSAIFMRHKEMAFSVITDQEILDRVYENIESHILKLERLLFGVAYTEELTPRTNDLILSSAERMSVYIMEGLLLENGILAKAYEADKIGIVTDGVFLCATANLPKCEENLKETILKEVDKGIVPVITGFFGADINGRTTTFGKNGSDYSAAVCAYSLDSDVLELYKDVNGFMSADPNSVLNSYPIETLSYDEAEELAYFGIDILHPRTMGPAKKKGIPIIIKNINNSTEKGTIIQNQTNSVDQGIKSVVYTTDLAEIRVFGTGAGNTSGILSIVSGILGQKNINIYSISTSHTHLCILVNKSDLEASLGALNGICGGPIDRISHSDDIALVCVVGSECRNKKGLSGKLFSAIGELDVNIDMISAGASDVAAHFIVKAEDLLKTLNAIHETFCTNTPEI